MTAVVSFFAFTATVAGISWWVTRKDRMDSSEAYFLAGRSLTAWVIAGSLLLTNLSTEHLIGLNADAFNHTIAVMAWETTAALAMVLAALYFLPKYLSIGLTGFFAAVMVGAVLSTFNSVLNSAATLFSEGIYRSTINKSSSGRNQVRVGRLVSTVLAIAAMLVAPTIDTSGSLYIYLQQINATFFGPMLAVILCGLMTRFINAKAAKISLLVGPLLFYLLNFAFGDSYQAFMMNLFGLSEPLHFLHTLGVVFVLTLALLVGLSLSSRDAEVAPVEAASAVSLDLTPWRYAKAAGAFISVATIACYIALAQ